MAFNTLIIRTALQILERTTALFHKQNKPYIIKAALVMQFTMYRAGRAEVSNFRIINSKAKESLKVLTR